jgi:hypothetical protein
MDKQAVENPGTGLFKVGSDNPADKEARGIQQPEEYGQLASKRATEVENKESMEDTEEQGTRTGSLGQDSQGRPEKKDHLGRVRKQTEKGIAFAKENRGKARELTVKRMEQMQKEIEELLRDYSNLSAIRILYKSWMEHLYEFLEQHDAYCSALTEVEKEDDYWSIFLDHDNQFKVFKSRMVDWINKAEADLRTLERNRVFKAASEKSSRSSRSSSMHSRSSASGSVRLAKAKEEQRIAGLVAKQFTLEKRRNLEQKKLALKLQEEDLELETEIAMA